MGALIGLASTRRLAHAVVLDFDRVGMQTLTPSGASTDLVCVGPGLPAPQNYPARHPMIYAMAWSHPSPSWMTLELDGRGLGLRRSVSV